MAHVPEGEIERLKREVSLERLVTAAGNLTTYATRTLGYDAENRQASLLDSGTTWSYFYDGDGRRVTREKPISRVDILR